MRIDQGRTYVTGNTGLLLLPPAVPPPDTIVLGNGGVEVLKLGILVDGSGTEVVRGLGGNGNGVTTSPPVGNTLLPSGTTGCGVEVTIGPTPPLGTVVVGDIPPPPGMLTGPPPEPKPAASAQTYCKLPLDVSG